MKFEIKKRVLPVAAPVDDLVYRDPNVTPNGSALPQDGSNIFSGVQIDASGNPIQLPRILPPEQAQTPAFAIPNNTLPETMTPPFNPNQPAFTVKPPVATPTPLEATQRRYEDAVNAEVPKQGLGKQILFQVLQGINRVATGSNEPIEMLGNYKKRLQVERAGQELGALQKAEDARLGRDLKQAQINTIPVDDEIARLRVEELREGRKTRLQTTALSKLNTLKTYDPKNAAMRKLAEQAGLDPDSIGAWDTRNPIEHSINGVRFRLNRETNKYEQTDLPIDEEKQLVDFTTKDGKKYRVSAKTAATLQTQFDTLGMRQDFQSRENQLSREHQLRLSAIAQQQKIELETIKNANDAIQKATDAATRAQAEERKRVATQRYNDLRDERLQLQNQKIQQELEP